MRLQPANTAAKIQLESTEKLIRRLEFDKAIASREEPSAIEKCSDQLKTGMDIEASYAGPRLRTDSSGSPEITQSFLDQMVTFFKDGKVLPRRIAWQIVLGAYNALSKEPSLVETTISQGQHIDVLGDTHGQYWDLCHCLKLTGQPGSDHKMVFNGDFVDRGSWSTEVVLTLFAYKWLYPEQVFLNRGNHETSDMNKVYGFEGETKKKYSEMTYKLFEEVFAALPIATLVTASCPPAGPVDARLPSVPILHKGTRRYLILHGGLFSKDETSLADVRKIQRLKSKQPQSGTIMSEALWSDPQAWPGRGPSKRGIGLDFGPDVTQRFAKTNELTGIIRSHEVRQEGYSIEHDGLCMTVFSAPNYIDQVGNKAAFIRISDDGKLDFETYEAQPHPAIRPMAYAASGFAQGMM
ncbi:uncharacterized protein L969DRAFT_72019 [Mixia osmundae IAM 14324]|nr:uncharacterized protein L969DRAFT_72019 [Mixia osmundae IAM 14324]KEI40671.1 hypothetical protein L969DRAFT_72019 [Mixia osmundae IAM 14324]